MDEVLEKLCKYFPSLSKHVLRKIYEGRCERLRMLMKKEIPEDIRLIIEAKVRLGGEIPKSLLTRYMPGLGKSTYSKKRRAKRLDVCHKCARWTCNKQCKSLGYVSENREDKINFGQAWQGTGSMALVAGWWVSGLVGFPEKKSIQCFAPYYILCM